MTFWVYVIWLSFLTAWFTWACLRSTPFPPVCDGCGRRHQPLNFRAVEDKISSRRVEEIRQAEDDRLLREVLEEISVGKQQSGFENP